MLDFVVKKIFGTRNDRVLSSLQGLVSRVAELESKYHKMSESELKAETERLKELVRNGESLDKIEPEAYAIVREAGQRTLSMRHFDEQIIGGAVLHRGMIAEMKTGEGKTLVATLPAYLNALSGKGVHIVTVNDYLARRDAEWMGQIYSYLGLSVGCVLPRRPDSEKREAYHADITYGQNNEFGFDYLRDNMKFALDDMSQRGHNFAIVDEVDSILIDEARTPLIISGPAEESTDLYYKINQIIPRLKEGSDFEIDLKSKHPTLSDSGVSHVEKLLGVENLYDPQHVELVHHVDNALRAHHTMQRDVDYLVKDGEVIIVDEFTGRMMPGRRWSNGLHQAVEAKEGLKIANENQTLASTTFQNYFRMYAKLAGMTGTADTEAMEFKNIYNLEVIVVPTHRKMIRDDCTDLVYKTRKEKYDAVCNKILELHQKQQPVLVGTISIEQSEALSKALARHGVRHNVLNAKHHEREADIVAQAGRLGAVTISTNMAGRGTDIVLGGNPEFLAAAEAGTRDRNDPAFAEALRKYSAICADEKIKVLELGGLHIIGTERHESRRIDNQLRGRAGRQGDPGSTQFYVSLEDDLMRRFGGERVQKIMDMLGVEEGVTLEGRMISRSIENAQKRVEGVHFDARKHILEYDDVMNKQRQVVYHDRDIVIRGEAVRERVQEMLDDLIEEAVLNCCGEGGKPVEWDLEALFDRFSFIVSRKYVRPADLELNQQSIFDLLRKDARKLYEEQIHRIGEPHFAEIERIIYLQSLDHFWKLHLLEMDHLRDGIGLRGYGQKNPLHEYQKEGFLLFQQMVRTVKEDVVRKLFAVTPVTEEQMRELEEQERLRRENQAKRLATIQPPTPTDETEDKSKRKSQLKDPEIERQKMEAARKLERKLKKGK